MPSDLAAVALSSLNRGPAHSLLRLLTEQNGRRAVRLIAPQGFLSERARERGIEVREIDPATGSLAGGLGSIRQLRSRFGGLRKPSVIANSVGAALRVAMSKVDHDNLIQIVHSEYMSKGDIYKYKILTRLSRNIRYLCVSNYVSGLMYGSFASGKNSVYSVPNSVDSSFYKEMPVNKNNTSPDKILFVGSQSRRKGYDVLLEVAERLVGHKLIHIKCAGVSPIDQWTGTEDHLQRTLDLKEHMKLDIMGRVEDVSGLMRWADLAFLPAPIESFGMPLIESAASCLPVVCSDNPGHKSVMKDRFTCRMFRSGDSDHAASVLSEAIDSYSDMLQYAEYARAMANAYSTSRVSDYVDFHIEQSILRPEIAQRWVSGRKQAP